MQSKKQLILWVLKLLENESDEKNPITQTHIAKTISEVYPCDRKTVCRNIKFLQAMGYPIKKTTKGFFIEGKSFSKDEVALVKAAIVAAGNDKSDLADRVACVLTKTYRR